MQYNYQTEEVLVTDLDCGGQKEQPICLYDFTVKTLSHDCLNFSTRLMNGGFDQYANCNYLDSIKNLSSSIQPQEESKEP